MTALVLLWSLTPCVAIWLGLSHFKSAVWAYFLYHGVCILPAIIIGRKLWTDTLVRPKGKDCAIIAAVAVLVSAGAVIGYELIGKFLLSNDRALTLLQEYIGSKQMMLALGAYAVVMNPLFEEIFWRGVVLNALDRSPIRWKYFGLCWSSCGYAALHYQIFRMVLFSPWAELLTIGHIFYGALLALIYRRTGSIITTAIAHGLFTDLACVVLVGDLLWRHPQFLTKLL